MQDFLHYLTLPYLWQGAVIAIELLVGALFGGIVIGFFLALASSSRHWWLRLPVQAYIYVLRGWLRSALPPTMIWVAPWRTRKPSSSTRAGSVTTRPGCTARRSAN